MQSAATSLFRELRIKMSKIPLVAAKFVFNFSCPKSAFLLAKSAFMSKSLQVRLECGLTVQ